MDLQLKDKKVLLTGATRGIGYGAARRFAEAGAKIWIHGSRKDSCEIAQQRLLEEFRHLKRPRSSFLSETEKQEDNLLTSCLLPRDTTKIGIFIGQTY